MTSTRNRIITTTCELLETQGYHATGLNQIVAESGAPKGSLYYYFPDGKEGLTAEAIERTGESVAARIRASLDEVEDPAEAVRRFILTIARYCAASDFKAGGPLTTVALEAAAQSERLRQACAQAYRSWEAAFEGRLIAGGMAPARAQRLAGLIIASIEGGVVLSRTYASVEPLERIAAELHDLVTLSLD